MNREGGKEGEKEGEKEERRREGKREEGEKEQGREGGREERREGGREGQHTCNNNQYVHCTRKPAIEGGRTCKLMAAYPLSPLMSSRATFPKVLAMFPMTVRIWTSGDPIAMET